MMNDDYVTQQMNQGVQATGGAVGIPEIVPQPVSELQQQMDAQQEQSSEPAAPIVNPDGSHKVLLVVDDNKLNLRVASKILQECGFEIDTVQSGFECIEKIKMNNKYDLIFMDIMMPQMDGVETMQKLKAMPGFTTPIIALTADAMEGSREKYLNAGFDEYLSKPIIKDIIQQLVNKYVSEGGQAPASLEQANAMVDNMTNEQMAQYAGVTPQVAPQQPAVPQQPVAAQPAQAVPTAPAQPAVQQPAPAAPQVAIPQVVTTPDQGTGYMG